jgi:altronate dehydratase large subunit
VTPELETDADADGDTGPSASQSDTESLAVQGFARDGRPSGVRNHVLVVPSVICSGAVAETVADDVPAATCTPHDHGCGQIGADEAQTRRTLVNVCQNPNVAGVVLVGLGCETISSESLEAEIDVPVRQTAIQTAGGTDAAIEAGREAATDLVAEAQQGDRQRVDPGDLTLGIAVGDLSDSTVEQVAPEVGRLARAVLDAGGRVVAAGAEALVPHADAVDELTTDEEAAGDLRDVLSEHREAVTPSGLRRASADHSPEAVAALWDGAPIADVVRYGERATNESGVAVVDSRGGFEESATALAAAGAQVVVHATADGVPTGHPVVPVVKVTGNSETAAAMPADIDVDATDPDESLLDVTRDVLDGGTSATEDHGLTSFAITRAGPSL